MSAVAACALSLLLAPPRQSQAADSTPAETRPCTCPGQNPGEDAPARQVRPKFADLQTNLDETDEIAALEAVRIALSEVGDGSTFVWRRENGRLSGVIKPTSSFRNVDGKICRHLIIVLAAGARTSKIEGVACRLGNGRWELDG
jgi:17 kDa outer membrane surface antigen